MRKLALTILGILLTISAHAEISIEREQEFTYYYYAAMQSIQQEKFDVAMMQLLFCEQLNPNDGKTKDYLGMMYDALRQGATATEYFRQAYDAEPLDLWKHYADKLAKGDKKKQKEAVKIVENVVRQRPKESDTWDYLRDLYTLTKQYSKALKAQDKIDNQKGYDAYSAINRYRIYVMNQKPQKAIQEIDRYLETDPTNMQFLLFRLQLLEITKAKWATLESAYEAILKIDPQNAMVNNNYAYGIAIRGGDLKKAERMSEMALRQDPNNATYLDTYAWVLHLQGQDVLAGFYIRKALDNAKDGEIPEIESHAQIILKK